MPTIKIFINPMNQPVRSDFATNVPLYVLYVYTYGERQSAYGAFCVCLELSLLINFNFSSTDNVPRTKPLRPFVTDDWFL
jgi:hypothetical protein